MKTFWLVITDLDGTLLDHFTYSMEPADAITSRLSGMGIPVIPCSSKTRPEMLEISGKAGLSANPLVIENGAEIILPDPCEQNIILGSERAGIIEALRQMEAELSISLRGFSSLTPEELAEITGLSTEQARMALAREYTEPFMVREGPENVRDMMAKWCAGRDLRLLEGGRFYHLQGTHDKGMALERLADIYRAKAGEKEIKTVALGDSSNDFDMLAKADFPVLVKRHDGTHAPWKGHDRIYRTEKIGPFGWKEAVKKIILKEV
jgi:mannosyl-3-phosphoglycerate phosphatase